MNDPTPTILWGATGQARVVRSCLDPEKYKLVALFDNAALKSPFSDVPIFVGSDGFRRWRAEHPGTLAAWVTIGGSRGCTRLRIQEELAAGGLTFGVARHRAAIVEVSASVGGGSQILGGSVVGVDARVGRAVIVNTRASVDHECVLEDGVHIAPGATLAGLVTVERFAMIGTGAVVLPRVRIGEGAIVGAGSVVTRDVPANRVVVGNPAKVSREVRDDER